MAGYFDQPHLHGDFREPAGMTPGEYLARDLEGHLWSFGTYVPGAEGSGN